MKKVDYSAGAVKYRFWFVEMRETARLLELYSLDEAKNIVVNDNLYQQNSELRLRNEFGCISSRIKALPEDLRKMLITADINTGKIIAFIACMATDKLLFELIYELYRNKLYYGDEIITDADFNVFFRDKQSQSEKLSKVSEASIKKLKQVYCKYMFEAGLLTGSFSEKRVAHVYIDSELRYALQTNAMSQYLFSLTGEL